uniref:Rho guanine nucleotide exchange factor 15 n=1 Tax=Sus scrofa TaxID=9823 RepID=I3LPE0_PIG
MSAQSLPAATPPTQKPPRIIRPRPPSRPRAAQSSGTHHNGSSPQEPPFAANDALAPMCTPIFWEPPASALKPPALLPPSASKASLDSQTSPDSPSGTPSPTSRRSISPEPAPRSPVPPPKPSGSPRTPLPLVPEAPVPAQDGSSSAPGTVRRLAGRFEWGTEGRVQAEEALEPGPPGAVDVNGERETPQAVLTGSGPQENGTSGKPMDPAPLLLPLCLPCTRPGLELRWVPVGGYEDGPRVPCGPPHCGPPAPAPARQASATPLLSSRPTAPLPSANSCRPSNPPNQLGSDRTPLSLGTRHSQISICPLKMASKQGTVLMAPLRTMLQQRRRAGMKRGWRSSRSRTGSCPCRMNPCTRPIEQPCCQRSCGGSVRMGFPLPQILETLPPLPGPRTSQHIVAGASGCASQWPPGHPQPPGEAHAGEPLRGGDIGASYLRSLRLLTDTFVLSQALRDTLTPRDHHTLFSNVQRVQGVSERFLGKLLSRVRSSPHISDLCDVVHAHAVGPFSVYVDYVRNQQYQEETYSRLMDTNVRFSAELRRLQSLPKCQRLPLPSFLLLPFQRITRLRMLLQNILRQTEEGSSRQENAQKALGAVSKIIERCSAEVGRMKQTEELIRLTQRLRFHKVKALPLVSWSRRLELQGELTELGCRRGGMLFASRPRFTPLCLLLFSDLLLITQPKSGQRLQVLDYAHRSLVQAQQVPDPSGPPTFRLSLLSNHQGRPTHRLLQASSLSDMQRWLGAFPTPGPLPCSPDTIYEDCDCPQELCSEPSTPTKAEGRNLESRAPPKHLHKSPEGWLKGLPGAFPAQLVCEVTGEHERRKHLRQHQRLLEAVGPSSVSPNAPPP